MPAFALLCLIMRSFRGTLLICFLYPLILSGQSAKPNPDSLWAVWNNPQLPDTARLFAIHTLAKSILYTHPDSAFVLVSQELAYAEKVKDSRFQGRALNTMGTIHNQKGDYPEALATFQKGIKIMQEDGDKNAESGFYANMGLVLRNMGNNAKALEFFQKYLDIQEQLGHKTGIANAYNSIGSIHYDQTNFPKALEYYLKSLQLLQTLGDKYGIAFAYNNIGSVYDSQGNLPLALEYYQKCLALKEDVPDQSFLGTLYVNIGLIYRKQGLLDRSFESLKEGVKILEAADDKAGLSMAYANLGFGYIKKKAFEKAISFCKKSFNLSKQINALNEEIQACNCLYNTYKAMGRSGEALAYHEQFVSLNDSLQKREIDDRLRQLEFQKEVLKDSLVREEEKQQIKVAYQKDLNQKTQVRNAILIISIGFLLLALLFLSRMLYFQKKSEGFQDKTQQLEKQQLINEIDLLRTQVNPHFLFNSLSILSSLVHVNPDLSEQFIDQLSRSYRYILDQKDQALVTLRTELEFIRSYAFLLKIRFEDKFDLRIQVDESLLDKYKIAPLTLQLLVENAVKHNKMSVAAPLTVDVYVENDCMIVKNPLRLRTQSVVSTKTGLNNIINRYALLLSE